MSDRGSQLEGGWTPGRLAEKDRTDMLVRTGTSSDLLAVLGFGNVLVYWAP